MSFFSHVVSFIPFWPTPEAQSHNLTLDECAGIIFDAVIESWIVHGWVISEPPFSRMHPAITEAMDTARRSGLEDSKIAETFQAAMDTCQ